ncbi:DUF453-domain-containing protein [Amniculicola lignicola CBS 123094]|uniref:DUF453-domain-containing protein n=1 Tax=Amniculicola lignicola CBS 123094 TaxID=1392246 RepID=A0A6A5X561_9PLEO|nr:DUF453-domain-containing protein [Amniculicola lignicola CBS 123094]
MPKRSSTQPGTPTRTLRTTTPHFRAQNSLPASYYRGGTSRALIFRAADLPTPSSTWPSIFRGVINSPDPHGRQLDGMGGGVSSLSKVCVVGPPTRDDADLDYTFAAIGVRDDEVDFSSNCGNMSAAIGPFAVDAGLVRVHGDGGVKREATVRIHNTNTGKVIRSRFGVEEGGAVVEGDFAIDGVAGTGAKIELAFLNPAGSKTGKLLPTGSVVDVLNGVEATCIDVGNPCVFVHAAHLDVEGSISADEMEAHPTLLKTLETIRRKAAVAMGICSAEELAPGSIPKIAIVSKPYTHSVGSGKIIAKNDCDLIARAISVGQPHRAVPITVAMALAAASKLEGSVVQRITSTIPVDPDGVTVGHNSGTLLVGARFGSEGGIEEATVFRTARRLFEGKVYWKKGQ